MIEDEVNKSIREKRYPWMTDEQFECFLERVAHPLERLVRPQRDKIRGGTGGALTFFTKNDRQSDRFFV